MREIFIYFIDQRLKIFPIEIFTSGKLKLRDIHENIG